jgi:hypothetical protein
MGALAAGMLVFHVHDLRKVDYFLVITISQISSAKKAKEPDKVCR